jgi:chromosome segregation ATPase
MKSVFFLILLSLPLAAQDTSPAEIKLREQLRSTALLLRAAETEKANARATFAAEQVKSANLQKEVDSLNNKVISMIKETDKQKTISEKTISSLNDKLTTNEERLKEYVQALEKWKVSHQQAVETAQQKEAARSELANQVLFLKNTIADRERKNLKLYSTSLEILDRYENYALGKALSAREPFIQKTRVTIETHVQDYKDTIIDHRLSAEKE